MANDNLKERIMHVIVHAFLEEKTWAEDFSYEVSRITPGVTQLRFKNSTGTRYFAIKVTENLS